MTTAKPKRRLELMPEVLPDPTPHYDAGAPRNRTLAHMRRMLTATAVVGVSMGAPPPARRGCGCHESDPHEE